MSNKQIRVVIAREDGSPVPHGELLISLVDTFDHFLTHTYDTFGLNSTQVVLRNDTHAYDFNRALYEEIVSAPYFNTDNLNIFCMVDSTAKCTNKLSLSSRVASAVSNISLDPKRMRKVHSDVLSPSLGLAPKNNLHSRAKASPIVKVNVIPSHSNATPVKSPMANGIVGRRLLGAAKPSGNISPNSSTGAKPILSHHHLHHHPLPRSPGVSPRSQDKRLTNLPMDQLAIYFNSDSKFPSIINIARASEAGNEFRATTLFEHAALRLPSSYRAVLQPETRCLSLQVQVNSLSLEVQKFLREYVCMSSIFVANQSQRTISTVNNPNHSELFLFFICEFPQNHDYFQLEAFLMNMKDVKARAGKLFWDHMFPAAKLKSTLETSEDDSKTDAKIVVDEVKDEHGEFKLYMVNQDHPCDDLSGDIKPADMSDINTFMPPNRPSPHKLFVLLDLDKTLFLSDADAREEQRHLFVGDYEIGGYMAITNERFGHRMMIRPGCHLFLRRLLQIAEVSVVTAGDLHYARQGVARANDRNWVSSIDESLRGVEIVDVKIPLERVFSVRNHPKKAAPKTFDRALPFFSNYADGGAVLAVDDDPGAWDASIRHHVIPITPFQPVVNSPDHLLNTLWLIEKCAAQFFHTAFQPDPSSQTKTNLLSTLVNSQEAKLDESRKSDKLIQQAVKELNITTIMRNILEL